MASDLLPVDDSSSNDQDSNILDDVLKSVQRDNQLYENDHRNRKHIEEHILTALSSFHGGIFELKQIGSGKTTLDTKKSEMSFSVVIKPERNTKMYRKLIPDRPHLMQMLENFWKSHSYALTKFYNVCLSLEGNPKYRPRLKFKHVESKLSCDLSYKDKCGEYASKLLSAYAEIDERVQIICHAMKHLINVCKIDNSEEGGLSSYVYMVMIIFFLQRTYPPTLPMLQKSGKGAPTEFVDGCNVWFSQDPQPPSPNQKSVGALWSDMLHFYGYEFDYKHFVISIRTYERILSEGSVLHVEDPLDPRYDLCQGLTESKNSQIIKVFQNSYERFHTTPKGIKSAQDYFFNYNALTGSLDLARPQNVESIPTSSASANSQHGGDQRTPGDHH